MISRVNTAKLRCWRKLTSFLPTIAALTTYTKEWNCMSGCTPDHGRGSEIDACNQFVLIRYFPQRARGSSLSLRPTPVSCIEIQSKVSTPIQIQRRDHTDRILHRYSTFRCCVMSRAGLNSVDIL